MRPEQERWAEALQVERMHGPQGQAFIAERIGALARSGELAGVRRWREIAACFEQLVGGVRS